MLVIRLRRIGKKKKPTYRLVVAERTMPVEGKFVEDVGYYNPHTKAAGLKKDEILDWLKKGAKPSNTVAKVLIKEKIKHDSVVVVKRHRKPKIKEEKVEKPAASVSKEPAALEPATEDQTASVPTSTSQESADETPEQQSETAPTA